VRIALAALPRDLGRPNRRYVADAGLVLYRSLSQTRETQRLIDPVGSIVTARFFPDGRRILTLSATGPERIWDLESGRILQSLGEPATGPVISGRTLLVSPDGARILAAGATSTLWDTTDRPRDIGFHAPTPTYLGAP
jgi:WD40 repeat protein